MNSQYTTISTEKEVAKVYSHLKGTGQSYNGFLKELAELKTGKNWKQLVNEAEEAEK